MARKNLDCTTLLFLVLLAVGSFFATYNIITLLVDNIAVNSGPLSFDPIVEMPDKMKRAGGGKVLYHVALTATDAPYSKWQCRIMYYWYKKMKDVDGSDMGKFTRILHSGQPDNLMDEIPTFVVDPLLSGLDRGYVVLNRPWAFVQWLERATIEEE